MDLQQLMQKAADLRNNGKAEPAVKVYQQVIGEALKKENKRLAAEAAHMVGVTYYMNNQYDLAEDFFLEALEQFKRIQSHEGSGATLRDMGMNAQKKGEYGKAKDYFYNSIYQLKEAGNLSHMGMTQVKLGMFFAEMGDLDKAEETAREGIGNTLKIPNSFFASTAYFDLAKILKRAGKTNESKEAVQKSLEILEKISNKEQFILRRKELEEFLKELGIKNGE